MKPKMNHMDFVRAISKNTGYAQKDISAVLDSGADVVLDNLRNGIDTAVFKGMVVYRSTYNHQADFPRARFGKFFKTLAPVE